MEHFLEIILEKISFFHINILFILGLALFGGTVGGRIFQKLRIPQVVGYIAIGVLLGSSIFNIITHEMIESFEPFNYFALGLIGFMIGGELKKNVLMRYGKQFIYILFFEGLSAFFLVSVFVTIVGYFILHDFRFSLALGLVLGSIASATAPAATTDVLWEYKTRGPLTTTIFGIVALDDALSLLLFAFSSSIASNLIGSPSDSVLLSVLQPIYEIGGAVLVGLISGLILSGLLKHYKEKDRILAFFVGTVLFVLGFSLLIHVSILLAAMTLGVVVVNKIPQISKEVFRLAEGFASPIYILFFVFVGAKLELVHLTPMILILSGVYLAGRTIGKMLGSNLGARISKAPENVQKYLPFCLFSQAGVAIGLSVIASHAFPSPMGQTIVFVITLTTLIVQVVGPSSVKYAVTKAEEIGLNVTEEDLITGIRIEDFIDQDISPICLNTSLNQILDIFSNDAHLYYPVVDKDLSLKGVITIDGIRQVFMHADMSEFLLAVDIMESVGITADIETSAKEINSLFSNLNLEYLMITKDKNKSVGCIERRAFHNFISTKMLELEKKAASLG